MTNITKKRHKHKAFDIDLLDSFGISKLLKDLKKQVDESVDRVLKPFKR